VGGHICDIRKCKALFAKWPVTGTVDRYEIGLTCGWERSAPSILDRAADAGVDRAVDHGPRVHGRPAEGGNPRSNLGRQFHDGRLGWPVSGRRRCPVVGQRRTAAARRRPRRCCPELR
jgi:hypothetical protein